MDENKFLDVVVDLAEKGGEAYSSIAETFSALGDLAEPVKALKGLINYSTEQRIKVFFQNFYCKRRVGIEDEELKYKLRSYLKKPQNLNFIADAINSVINSRSIKCTGVLGFYAAKMLVGLEDIQYKDYLAINALKNMLDYDLDNFINIYNNLFDEDFEKTYRLSEYTNRLGEDIFQLELTIEKLKNEQILGYDVGGAGNSGNAWGMFVFNSNSKYFYEILKKSMI